MKPTLLATAIVLGLLIDGQARVIAQPTPAPDDPSVVALTRLHGVLKKHVDTLGQMPSDLQELLDLGFVQDPVQIVSPRSISGRAPAGLLPDRTPWRILNREFTGWLLVSDEAIDRTVYALHAGGQVQRFIVAPEAWYGEWTVPEYTKQAAEEGHGRLVPGLELALIEVPTTVARPAVIVTGFRREDPIRDELRSEDRLLNVGGYQVTTLAELENFIRARPDVSWTEMPLLVLREYRTIEIGLERPVDGYPSAPDSLYPPAAPATLPSSLLSDPALSRRPTGGGTLPPELFPAAEEGNLKAVLRLLRAGTDADTRDERGFTPLMIAVYRGHTGLVNELLAAGADVNAVAARNETPLLASIDGDHLELFRLLIQRGANKEFREDGGGTLLAAACHGGNIDMIRAVLKLGVDINGDSFYREGRRFKGTALMVAASLGRDPVVTFLLDQGAKVDAVGEEGYTALMLAALGDERAIVSELLAAGADPTLRNEAGKTALDLAREANADRVIPVIEQAMARALRR